MIPITRVKLDEEAERLVLEVLRSGRLAQGPMVERFESEFARLIGADHAVAVSSGTIALVAAFDALRLAPGDEIITTPFTFVATLNAALQAGATVRLVDIRDDDYTIDPEAVRAAVTRRTRAIVPIHIYGYPADLPSLAKIASDIGAVIIEDAAQAHAATVEGRPVGTWGMGAFSFYATKNLTTGEGGMVTTDVQDWADHIRLLRNQGMRQRYEYLLQGNNYRMTEVQAAIGLAQICHLHDWTERRREHARRLSAGLADLDGVVLPREAAGRQHVYHQFTIRLAPASGLSRDLVAADLRNEGIETGVYYPRLCHDHPCFQSLPTIIPMPLPVATRMVDEVLSLPVHQWLSDEDVDQIVDALRSVISRPR
jgi:perosamine synthetase